jgi:hypothetical protein
MDPQPWRARRIHRAIGPILGYLSRLRRRTEQRVSPNDEFFRLVMQAFDAMHALSVHQHYKSVGGALHKNPSLHKYSAGCTKTPQR